METVSAQARGQCVLWMHECQSPTEVRRKYRIKYSIKSGHDLPSRRTIKRWYEHFLQTGYVRSQSKQGKQLTGDVIVDRLAHIYDNRPDTSLRIAKQHVPVSLGTVYRIVRKQLKLYPYKIQMVHALKPEDYPKRRQFAELMLGRTAEDPSYPRKSISPTKPLSIPQVVFIGTMFVSGEGRTLLS